MGNRERQAEGLQGFCYGLFVFRVRKREQKGNGDGLRMSRRDLFEQLLQILRSWGGQDLAIGSGAFIRTEAEIFRHERLNALEEKIVELGAGLASDLDGVFEADGCDQGGAGAFAFEQRIGSDSGAVEEDATYRKGVGGRGSQVSQRR